MGQEDDDYEPGADPEAANASSKRKGVVPSNVLVPCATPGLFAVVADILRAATVAFVPFTIMPIQETGSHWLRCGKEDADTSIVVSP